MGFEVVEVRAGAVDFVRDVVAGTVREVFAKAGGLDDAARGVIGLEAADGAAVGKGLFDGGNGGVAGVADGRSKTSLLAFVGFAANDAGPGDVVVERSRACRRAPQMIDEEEVAFLEWAGTFPRWARSGSRSCWR